MKNYCIHNISRAFLMALLFWHFNLQAGNFLVSEDKKTARFTDSSGVEHDFIMPDAYTPIEGLNDSLSAESRRVTLAGSPIGQNRCIGISGTVPFPQNMEVSQVYAVQLKGGSTVSFIIQTTDGNTFLNINIGVDLNLCSAVPDESARGGLSPALMVSGMLNFASSPGVKFYSGGVGFSNNQEVVDQYKQFLRACNYNVVTRDSGKVLFNYTISIREGVEWFPSDRRLILPWVGSPIYNVLACSEP